MFQQLQTALKKMAWAARLNRYIKTYLTVGQYRKWCRRYKSYSVLSPEDARQWHRHFGREAFASQIQTGNLVGHRFFFVGTSWDQDRSGIIQGLRAHGEVAVFSGPEGKNELLLPASRSEISDCREANKQALQIEFKAFQKLGPVSALIGQMWNFAVPVQTLAGIQASGVPVVNLAMDDRHSFHLRMLADGSDGGVAGLVPALTLGATAAPECVTWYERLGGRAFFLPEASDANFFRPMAGPKTHDITFVGANYGFRTKVISALRLAGLRVNIYGSGWPDGRIATEAIPELFARSRIVLGIGGVLQSTSFTALKLRDFDAPMSGSFYLTQSNPDLELVFRVGEEIETWHGIPDLIKKCRHYLSDVSTRERIAAAGRARAVREHTWAGRFGALLKKLDELPTQARPFTHR